MAGNDNTNRYVWPIVFVVVFAVGLGLILSIVLDKNTESPFNMVDLGKNNPLTNPVTHTSEFGHYGSGNAEFHIANGIATNSKGNFYVVDQVNNRIQILGSEGVFLGQISGLANPEQIQFNNPHGIAIDHNDNIYVADLGGSRIVVLGPNGNLMFEFGSFCNAVTGEHCYDPDEEGPLKTGDGQFHAPYDIALDSQNNIYVTDVTSSFIQKFDPQGIFMKKWGGGGTSNGQFIGTHGIGVDDDDDVYVVDRENNRVQVFDSEGNWIKSFVNDSNNDFFDQPRGLTVHENTVYVTNGGTHHNVVAFDLTKGSKIFEFGSYCDTDSTPECMKTDVGSEESKGKIQFDEPHDIAISEEGKIVVTDGHNHRIQVFSDK